MAGPEPDAGRSGRYSPAPTGRTVQVGTDRNRQRLHERQLQPLRAKAMPDRANHARAHRLVHGVRVPGMPWKPHERAPVRGSGGMDDQTRQRAAGANTTRQRGAVAVRDAARQADDTRDAPNGQPDRRGRKGRRMAPRHKRRRARNAGCLDRTRRLELARTRRANSSTVPTMRPGRTAELGASRGLGPEHKRKAEKSQPTQPRER